MTPKKKDKKTMSSFSSTNFTHTKNDPQKKRQENKEFIFINKIYPYKMTQKKDKKTKEPTIK